MRVIVPKKWSLEHSATPVNLDGITCFSPVPVLEDAAHQEGLEYIRKRAQAIDAVNHGLELANNILEQPGLIPDAWEEKILVFPGDIWKMPCGSMRMLILWYGQKEWEHEFIWAKTCSWSPRDHFVRVSYPQG